MQLITLSVHVAQAPTAPKLELPLQGHSHPKPKCYTSACFSEAMIREPQQLLRTARVFLLFLLM